MDQELIVTRQEGWAQIQINREPQRNAMNRATRQGLRHQPPLEGATAFEERCVTADVAASLEAGRWAILTAWPVETDNRRYKITPLLFSAARTSGAEARESNPRVRFMLAPEP